MAEPTTETTFKRNFRSLERAESDPSGLVRGVLASDGEAEDGHILNVDGLEAEPPVSLLFGHDAWSQRGTVGSWIEFEKGKDAGQKVLRGAAQIELGGEGANAAERRDLAYMTDRGHFRAFSVRWEALEPPVRRVNLSKDHPAFVDGAKETDCRKLYGYYFPRARVLEGSIVPMGSDPAALIGRAKATTGGVRKFWLGVARELLLGDALRGDLAATVERFKTICGELRAAGVDDIGTLCRLAAAGDLDVATLREVRRDDRARVLIPTWAHDTLTQGSAERLRLAFDLLEFADDGVLEPDAPQPEPDPPQRPALTADGVRALISGEIGALEERLTNSARVAIDAALRGTRT